MGVGGCVPPPQCRGERRCALNFFFIPFGIPIYKDATVPLYHGDGSDRLYMLGPDYKKIEVPDKNNNIPPAVYVHPDRWDEFKQKLDLKEIELSEIFNGNEIREISPGGTVTVKVDYPMPPVSEHDYWSAVTGVPCPTDGCDQTVVWYEAGYVPGYRVCMKALGGGRFDEGTLRHRFIAKGNAKTPILESQ